MVGKLSIMITQINHLKLIVNNCSLARGKGQKI